MNVWSRLRWARGGSAGRAGASLLALGALCGVLGSCDATETGAMAVTLELRSDEGTALDCEAVGAQEVELLLFLRDGDVLPYDRVAWPCAVGTHTLRVDARSYAAAEARLAGPSGATVRLCGAQGTMEARLSWRSIRVAAGRTTDLVMTLLGAPGSCPAPAPSPN